MKIVSIDIETTGLNPEIHRVTQLGAVVYDTNDPFEIKLGEPPLSPHFLFDVFHFEDLQWSEFAMEIQPEYPLVSDFADEFKVAFGMDSVWESEKERFNAKREWYNFRRACPANEVLVLFREFLEENGIDKVIPMGKNFAGFDLRFLRRMAFFNDINWCHRSIDPTVLFIESCDTIPPNLQQCLRRAGVEKDVSHNALEDALDVIFCFDYGIKNRKCQRGCQVR